jgi:hypothetical protein
MQAEMKQMEDALLLYGRERVGYEACAVEAEDDLSTAYAELERGDAEAYAREQSLQAQVSSLRVRLAGQKRDHEAQFSAQTETYVGALQAAKEEAYAAAEVDTQHPNTTFMKLHGCFRQLQRQLPQARPRWNQLC